MAPAGNTGAMDVILTRRVLPTLMRCVAAGLLSSFVLCKHYM